MISKEDLLSLKVLDRLHYLTNMDNVYDRALSEIGNENKYQNRYDFIYHIAFVVIFMVVFLNILLALTVTPHECKIPEKPQNISEIDWRIRNIPRYENSKGNNMILSFISACLEYTYDKTWYETTVTSENNWVCDKEMNGVSVLMYTKLAEVVGSIFFGWFSDVYGRRYTYIITTTMLLVGRFISLMGGNSYIIFFIGCLIASFPSTTALQTVSIICLEMSSVNRGSAIVRLRLVASSFGIFLTPLFMWWARDWKLFLIVTTAPLIPFVIMSWKVIESPRWLYSQGRVEESLIILKKIAKTNNKNMEANTEKLMMSLIEEAEEKPQVFGVFSLFSSRRLALNTILQAVIWMAASLSYTYLVMSSGERTDSNPFLDFALQALAEIPSIYLAAWLSDRIGRRYTGITSISVLAVMWTTVIIRENSTGGLIREWWVGSAINIIARLSTIITVFVLNLLTMEFYPTCLRQSGMAFGNVIAGIVSAAIPFVMYLGRRYDPRIPGFILAATSLFGFVAAFILPETLNAKLPETLEEAKCFGSKDISSIFIKFCSTATYSILSYRYQF
ncbi:organic cation transporter protein [Melitaea cinxia]|uniref:organic cation transporter protein n=1 Tax=Melitaea cinxia TaxID=113334 RepID=UPI001E270E32|nr:organic cation transporter protein [Melitaea cinxia]